MKKNEKAIIYGAGAVLVGFGLYRYFQRKQSEKKAVAETVENNTNPTLQMPSVYKQKVMDIQSFLGVAVDGIPGPQTNGAWARRAPATYAKYGPIGPANIDFYNALVKGPANLII